MLGLRADPPFGPGKHGAHELKLDPMALAEIVDRHRVLVCLGSGGVGKTTTSAAIALRAALQGRRTLCLTIDPARRLANSLGLSELRGEEQLIDPACLEPQGLRMRGSLSAMMLDMKHTFDELVERYASSPAQRQRILANRIYQYVSTSLAGTQEYMAMEKLHSMRNDPRFDFIVLDTPPTTNALDFLEAPQKLVGAIDSPVMRWFVQSLRQSTGLNLLGRSVSMVLRGLSKFTGAEFLDHVGEFITDVNQLFGGFRDRAKSVYDDLRGPDVAFVIVTSPSPQAVGEAAFFSDKLREYGISPDAVVVNRVQAPVELRGEPDPAELAALLPAGADVQALLDGMRDAAYEQSAMAARDREGIRLLGQQIGENTVYAEVPALDRDVHDLVALAQIGQHLMGPLAA
jgi:anion-transporting  ArsA/GET3 family ATPase